MKIFSIVSLIFLFSAPILGQNVGTLTGRAVVDDAVDTAINGANVTLTSVEDTVNTFTTKADAAGRFSFENIPPGDYRIKADGGLLANSMEGEQPIRIVAGVNGPITVVVRPVDGISESVTISVSENQPIEQVSKTVDTVDAQEMRDRADFTLVDTLRSIPGFRIQQLGGFGRTASIKARGLRNHDTALLLDGIRFRDPGAITGDASPFLSDITLTSVSRIEVLRGSGSSLYGTNAIGGTVDFQTPRPTAGVHGQVSGAAGGLGLGRFRGNLSYGTPNGEIGVAGALARTVYTKGIDGQDNAGNTNFQSRLDFQPASKTNLSGRFFFSDSKVRLNSSPDTLGTLPPTSTIIDAREGVNFVPDVNDPDSFQRGRFFTGQFSVTHIVNPNLILSGHYQGLTTRRRNNDGTLGVGFQSEFTSIFAGAIHTADVHARWTIRPSQTFTAGYEFESEQFRNEGSTPSGTDDFWTRAGQRSNTLYAQHIAGFFDDRLQLAGGVRAQWFSLQRPRFSDTEDPYSGLTLSDPPAAYTVDGSASYFISSTGTKFRMHAGNGYRVPSLYERFGTFFFLGSFFRQGNPELKPERSIGIDAGVEQYFAGKRVKATATWFYTRIKDEITYLPTNDFAYYNFDRHFSRGAELSVDIRPTRSTDIFASYTFTNSDIRNFRRQGLGGVVSNDRRSFGIPDHQLTLVVTQRIRRFWATLDLLATSSYRAPIFSSTTFDSYTYRFEGNRRADLTAGYTFKLSGEQATLRVFGTVENLLDNKYFENGFRTSGRNGRAGLSIGF